MYNFQKHISESCENVPCELVLFNSVNSIHDHNGLCFHARVFNSCYLSYFESVQTFISDFVFVYAMFGLIWWCFYQLVLHFQLRFTHLTMFTCRFYSSNALETSTYSVWICSLVSSTFICCYCQTYSTVCINNSQQTSLYAASLFNSIISVNHKRHNAWS